MLYLWIIDQKLGVGFPLVRREENDFRREFPQSATGCHDWIDWLAQEQNIDWLAHERNIDRLAHERNIENQSALHGGEIENWFP